MPERARTSRKTALSKSSGQASLRPPFFARVMGVRTGYGRVLEVTRHERYPGMNFTSSDNHDVRIGLCQSSCLSQFRAELAPKLLNTIERHSVHRRES
jgi:hypothetical protein